MTSAEGILSFIAIICPTLASAEMLGPGWPLALTDDHPGQHLLRGLNSHLVSGHTTHIFSHGRSPHEETPSGPPALAWPLG